MTYYVLVVVKIYADPSSYHISQHISSLLRYIITIVHLEQTPQVLAFDGISHHYCVDRYGKAHNKHYIVSNFHEQAWHLLTIPQVSTRLTLAGYELITLSLICQCMTFSFPDDFKIWGHGSLGMRPSLICP